MTTTELVYQKTKETMDYLDSVNLLKSNISSQIKTLVDNYKKGSVDEIPYVKEGVEFTEGWLAVLSVKDDNVFDVYYVTSTTGKFIDTHTHKQKEVIMVIDGEIELSIFDKKVILNQGESYTIREGEPHSVKVNRDCKLFVLFRPPITVYN
jgi:quercetin dioxygenase-like cupin family protein